MFYDKGTESKDQTYSKTTSHVKISNNIEKTLNSIHNSVTSEISVPEDIKKAAEERFNVDVSGVRVIKSDVLDQVGVSGYAQGDVIGVGSSKASYELIAHEIAHIAQQAQNRVHSSGEYPIVYDEDLEHEAEMFAKSINKGVKTTDLSNNTYKIKPMSSDSAPAQLFLGFTRTSKQERNKSKMAEKRVNSLYFGGREEIIQKNKEEGRLFFNNHKNKYKEVIRSYHNEKNFVTAGDTFKSKKSDYLKRLINLKNKYGKYITQIHPEDLYKRSDRGFLNDAKFLLEIGGCGDFIAQYKGEFTDSYEDEKFIALYNYYSKAFSAVYYYFSKANDTEKSKNVKLDSSVESDLIDKFYEANSELEDVEKLCGKLDGFTDLEEFEYSFLLQKRKMTNILDFKTKFRNKPGRSKKANNNGEYFIPIDVVKNVKLDKVTVYDVGSKDIINRLEKLSGSDRIRIYGKGEIKGLSLSRSIAGVMNLKGFALAMSDAERHEMLEDLLLVIEEDRKQNREHDNEQNELFEKSIKSFKSYKKGLYGSLLYLKKHYGKLCTQLHPEDILKISNGDFLEHCYVLQDTAQFIDYMEKIINNEENQELARRFKEVYDPNNIDDQEFKLLNDYYNIGILGHLQVIVNGSENYDEYSIDGYNLAVKAAMGNETLREKIKVEEQLEKIGRPLKGLSKEEMKEYLRSLRDKGYDKHYPEFTKTLEERISQKGDK